MSPAETFHDPSAEYQRTDTTAVGATLSNTFLPQSGEASVPGDTDSPTGSRTLSETCHEVLSIATLPTTEIQLTPTLPAVQKPQPTPFEQPVSMEPNDLLPLSNIPHSQNSRASSPWDFPSRLSDRSKSPWVMDCTYCGRVGEGSSDDGDTIQCSFCSSWQHIQCLSRAAALPKGYEEGKNLDNFAWFCWKCDDNEEMWRDDE